MKRILWLVIAAASLAPFAGAQAPVSATAAASASASASELTALLNEFLAGVSRGDPAVHERFWAEDLIYTSASGRRIGKADILKDARPAGGDKPAPAPSTTYTSEDVRVHEYGDTAVRRVPARGDDAEAGRARSREVPEHGDVREARRTVAGRRLAGDALERRK